MIRATLALLLVLLVASTAGAETFTTDGSLTPAQVATWQASFDSGGMPRLADGVELVSPCPDARVSKEQGCWPPSQPQTIAVPLGSDTWDPTWRTYAIWHEDGHRLDGTRATPADRDALMTILGFDGGDATSWGTETLPGQPSTRLELWADALGTCAATPWASLDGAGYGWKGIGLAHTQAACAWFARWLTSLGATPAPSTPQPPTDQGELTDTWAVPASLGAPKKCAAKTSARGQLVDASVVVKRERRCLARLSRHHKKREVKLTRRDRGRRLRRAQQHQIVTKQTKRLALDAATAAAKRSKKGEAGIVSNMRKFGYILVARVERITKRVPDEHGNRRRVTTERMVERYVIGGDGRRTLSQQTALDAAVER